LLVVLGKSHKTRIAVWLDSLVLLVKATHAFVQSLLVFAPALVLPLVALSAFAVVYVVLALVLDKLITT
jgi:hypothetical protein